MKVTQFEVKNQFIITSDKGEMFQSYDSPICLVDNNKEVHLSDHWDYSRTTMKYLGRFLGMDSKEIRASVKSGEFKMDLSLNGEVAA
jgi:hypothetical protein